MSDIINLSIRDLRALISKKKISVKETLQAYQARIAKFNASLNAYVTVTDDVKEEDFDSSKKLSGIPIAVKDVFCTKGVLTTAGSRMLENFVPPYESSVTKKAFHAGAIMLGKTNMDEFAMGSTTTSGFKGASVNPWGIKESLVAGGSSGGSAVAVAAGMALVALGSDTGGSVRQPASFCGLVGVKPTFGRCSRYGMIAFASSLDQAGVFARNVEDAAITLQEIMGFDVKDATCVNKQVPDLSSQLNQKKSYRIGIPKEYLTGIKDKAVLDCLEKAKKGLLDMGHEVIEVSLPLIEEALAAYYIIAPAEASSNLARYDGIKYGKRSENYQDLESLYCNTRSEKFGEEVKRRIMMGTYVLSAGYYDSYYLKAQQIRRMVFDDFSKAFAKVDVLLTPTTPSAAFSADNIPSSPLEVYHNDIFTVPISLAGLPAISLPAGFSSKLPLGVQLVAPSFEESRLFSVASNLEEALAYKFTIPTLEI